MQLRRCPFPTTVGQTRKHLVLRTTLSRPWEVNSKQNSATYRLAVDLHPTDVHREVPLPVAGQLGENLANTSLYDALFCFTENTIESWPEESVALPGALLAVCDHGRVETLKEQTHQRVDGLVVDLSLGTIHGQRMGHRE